MISRFCRTRACTHNVGAATTSSVVTAITTVIAFDTLFNVVLVALFDK